MVFVTSGYIARKSGKTPQNAARWAAKQKGFPEPVAKQYVGQGKLYDAWDKSKVDEFFKKG